MKYIILILSISLIASTGFARKNNSKDIEKACFDMASKYIDIEANGTIELSGTNQFGACNVLILSDVYTSGTTKEETGTLRVMLESNPDNEGHLSTETALHYNHILTKQKLSYCKFMNNTLSYKSSDKHKTGWRSRYNYKTDISLDDQGKIEKVKLFEKIKRRGRTKYNVTLECNISS